MKLNLRLFSIIIVGMLALTACKEAPKNAIVSEPVMPIDAGIDYHSFSNPDEIKVTHIDLDLTADFIQKSLIGSATLTFERVNKDATILVVDTRDLAIADVSINDSLVEYSVKAIDENLGAALHISVGSSAQKVTIKYQTAQTASGVQWLTPEQTAG